MSSCTTVKEPSASAHVTIEYAPASIEESAAFKDFFSLAEKAWQKSLMRQNLVSEESEIVLILVPAGSSKLEIREVEYASPNLTPTAGRAAVFAISTATEKFRFPSSLYFEIVRAGQLRLIFRNKK
jgi:hypothetical protein